MHKVVSAYFVALKSVTIELPYGKNAVMRICNTLGEEVMRKNLYYYFKYLEVDAAPLQNGVYLLTIEINRSVSATGKLVITK